MRYNVFADPPYVHVQYNTTTWSSSSLPNRPPRSSLLPTTEAGLRIVGIFVRCSTHLPRVEFTKPPDMISGFLARYRYC